MGLRGNKVVFISLLVFSFLNAYIFMIQHNLISSTSSYFLLFYSTLVLTLFFFALSCFIRCKLKNSKLKLFEENFSNSVSLKRYSLIIWIVQLVCWLPVFLAYYPGLFTYDVAGQVTKTFGSYNTHQPLLHTLYIKFFYNFIGGKVLNDYTSGIALATIAQMIIFSASLSYAQAFLRKSNVSKLVRYLLILFVCTSPIFSLLAISMTKDTFFTCGVLLFITSFAYHVRFPNLGNKRSIYIYIFSIIAVVLLRNNGIFAIIAYLLIIVIRYLKEREDCKFLLRTIISVVLAIFFSMGLKTALQATSGSINEALSVPYQQIACAYNDKKDQLSEEEKKEIFKFVPDVEHYDQSLSDPVKYEGRASEDFLGFANLYFEMFARFPGSYFKAFCMLNAGYFSPTDTSFAEIYGTKNRQGIFLTDTKEGFQVEHTSYFPQLEKLYERLYTENKYEKIPVLNISCSPSIYFWILVFLIIYSIYKKQFKLSSITAFLVVFLLTLLASPACLIRYALPLIVCIPIFCTCVLKE